jgi:dipeptidyl aminopeptidase/acylaminoacyl peptidase
VKRRLERIEVPGEHEARERSWYVVRTAWEERQPAPRARPFVRPALALAGVLAVLGAVLSPPGRGLVDEVREAIGVERAAPGLFSLPASGQLLVTSDRGAWIVRADGSKRLLGRYREASWSPSGLFVVAARRNELVALAPNGDPRWTLGRPNVRLPRWGGTRSDTRIAYVSGSRLRIVAGDGAPDRPACGDASADVAPAWRPGGRHELALVAPNGTVSLYAVEGCRLLGRSRPLGAVRRLEWSTDGSLLLVQGTRTLVVLDERARVRFDLLGRGAAPVEAAALAPTGRAVAFVQRVGNRSQLWLIPRLRPDGSAARRVFSGAGRFTTVSWSPDGRWLLVAWRDADQWLFFRTTNVGGVRAVSSISSQFRSTTFPTVEGWCCAAR